MFAGHCPECGRAVYTRPGAEIGRCRGDGCDGEVDVSDWRRMAIASIDDMTMPASDIARALTALGQPVTANQIYLAASRGRFEPVDVQSAPATGSPTFDACSPPPITEDAPHGHTKINCAYPIRPLDSENGFTITICRNLRRCSVGVLSWRVSAFLR